MTDRKSKAWSRRRVLVAGGKVAASYVLPSAAWASELKGEDGVEDPEDLYWEQAEPPPSDFVRTRSLRDWPLWWKQTVRPTAVWAPDGISTDDAHLGQPYSADEFVLTAGLLRRALQLTHIPEAPLGDRVLFGVRAAQHAEAPTKPQSYTRWVDAVRLLESRPDHFRMRCVLGVWNRRTDQLWTGVGSTICNVAYLFGQAKAKHRDKLCNLLPAGVYKYQVGTHRNGAHSRQPGAFRLASKVAIQRNYDERQLGFSTKDYWEFRDSDVSDNIHAAYGARTGMPTYSSAGCQVLEGTAWPPATREHPTRAWKHFRVAAGLKPKPKIIVPNPERPMFVRTDEDGRRYTYVLLTARELRLASRPASRATALRLAKLRRGSRGPRVMALQAALRLRPDGDFGPATQRAVINRQMVYLNQADGVVTRARLSGLRLPATLFS